MHENLIWYISRTFKGIWNKTLSQWRIIIKESKLKTLICRSIDFEATDTVNFPEDTNEEATTSTTTEEESGEDTTTVAPSEEEETPEENLALDIELVQRRRRDTDEESPLRRVSIRFCVSFSMPCICSKRTIAVF